MHPLLEKQGIRVLVLGPSAEQRLQSVLTEINSHSSSRFYVDLVPSIDELNPALIAQAPGLSLVFRDLGSEAEVREAIAALRATSGFPPMLLYPNESEEAFVEYSQLGAADFADWHKVDYKKIQRWFHLAASRSLTQHAQTANDVQIENEFDAKSHFHAVTESLAEGLTIFTRDGVLEFCNRRFEELTGYSRQELKGKKVYDIFFPEGTPERTQYLDLMEKRYYARRRGVNEIYETQIYRKNGERRWIETKAAPLRDIDGRIIGSVGANTDITERKNLEEQLRWSQKMEAVGRLAGGVAHDFNNLLTAIFGYSEMILKKMEENDPLFRKIQIIRKSSEAACALTRQLLVISRKAVVQKKRLSVNKILRESDDIIRGLVGSRIDLVIEESDSPVSVDSDAGQLQQIIINLAINARDAMDGCGTLKMSATTKNLPCGMVTPRSSLKPGNYLVLSVKDSGCGMTREVLSHLFEPFYTTKQGKGTGLGLSTVYAIVKQHKGEILVDSQVGVGSTFEVYIPAINSGESLGSDPADVEIAPTNGFEKILVAEDEDSVRSLVAEVLEQQGYDVSTARDGAEALEIALGTDSKFDLLLTDVVMPKLNGIELAKELLEQLPELKVIFMSGYTSDSTIPDTVRKLQTPFLPKPFSPETLAEIVRKTLDCVELETTAEQS